MRHGTQVIEQLALTRLEPFAVLRCRVLANPLDIGAGDGDDGAVDGVGREGGRGRGLRGEVGDGVAHAAVENLAGVGGGGGERLSGLRGGLVEGLDRGGGFPMQGRAGEEAALTLGASGWQTFWHVTLPNIRFALLYGVLLCNARAMGEFGAVSVVSGHIRGETNTMPLHIEVLYNEYNFVAAFAVASLLALLALVTLALKSLIEWRHRDEIAAKF